MSTRFLSAEQLTEDDFGVPFEHVEGEIVYDAKTASGPWATMTETSFRFHGDGCLGTGFGQKYKRNAQGHLVKVAG